MSSIQHVDDDQDKGEPMCECYPRYLTNVAIGLFGKLFHSILLCDLHSLFFCDDHRWHHETQVSEAIRLLVVLLESVLRCDAFPH